MIHNSPDNQDVCYDPALMVGNKGNRNHEVKSLLVLLAATLAVAGLVACGTANRSGDSPTAVHATKLGDHDDGDDAGSHNRAGEKNDDLEVIEYGQPGSAAELRTATAFARRYFTAAAAENGAAACSLLLKKLADNLAASIGRPPNPVYLRGKTCAAVMTGLFRYRHAFMAKEAAGLHVTGLRVTRRTAFILLSFSGVQERRYMGVERVGNTWKLEALIDSEYP